VFWSSAYVDWEDDKKGDLEYAYNSITQQFHNGSIILLHNTSGNNAEVLAKVIAQARKEGFEFGNLDDIKQ
jgi:peptidoglycan-N-acetylmuramic acid deacetylase